jgi:hypothetical protein
MIEDCKKHNHTQSEINELSSYEWVIKCDGKQAIRYNKNSAIINDLFIPLEWCIEKHELDEVYEEINDLHDKYGGIK